MNTDEALQKAIMQVAQAKVAEALGGDVPSRFNHGGMADEIRKARCVCFR